MAHHTSWEPSFFVTHFIDGLRKEIRAAVVLHRPVELPSAVDLAILQEEVLESFRRDSRRQDFSPMPRYIPHMAMPLPAPPQKGNPPEPFRGEERRAPEAIKTTLPDDKVSALRNYRRTRGLCFICSERRGRDHRCGPTVQLYVVEELLAMVQHQEDPESSTAHTAEDTESELMHISQAAAEGGHAATTMRLQGWIQHKEVLMLIDSGSSHTFISAALVDRLQTTSRQISPLRVKVANGGPDALQD